MGEGIIKEEIHARDFLFMKNPVSLIVSDKSAERPKCCCGEFEKSPSPTLVCLSLFWTGVVVGSLPHSIISR